MKDLKIPEADAQWLARNLTALGVDLEAMIALKVEASHRTFYRIALRSKGQSEEQTKVASGIRPDQAAATMVFMRSPPKLEANQQFVDLAEAFATAGVAVPRVVAKNMQLGCFLLSDLGDVHLQEIYGTALQTEALSAAIAELSCIASTAHPAIEEYSSQRLLTEIGIFEEWFQGAYLGLPPMDMEPAKNLLAESIYMQPKCCVHRDFHCRNLLYNGGNIGVVDFQDALYGPILYDIASLLHDCYHFFNADTVTSALGEFLKLPHVIEYTEGTAQEEIKRQFDFTAIQRQIKAIGIFARLALRDGKQTHLPHIRPNLLRTIAMCGPYSELRGLEVQLKSCLLAFDGHALAAKDPNSPGDELSAR